MVKTPATHDAIGSDSSGDGVQTRGQNCRQANAFKLFGDRSPATRPGASRRGDDDRPDTALLQVGGNLCAHAFHGI